MQNCRKPDIKIIDDYGRWAVHNSLKITQKGEQNGL